METRGISILADIASKQQQEQFDAALAALLSLPGVQLSAEYVVDENGDEVASYVYQTI